MSFNFYKWVMSLLKIDKTKGKEFVLDSICTVCAVHVQIEMLCLYKI